MPNTGKGQSPNSLHACVQNSAMDIRSEICEISALSTLFSRIGRFGARVCQISVATKYKLNLPAPEELNEEVARQKATLLVQLSEKGAPK